MTGGTVSASFGFILRLCSQDLTLINQATYGIWVGTTLGHLSEPQAWISPGNESSEAKLCSDWSRVLWSQGRWPGPEQLFRMSETFLPMCYLENGFNWYLFLGL